MANGIFGSNQNNPYPQTEFLDPQTKRPTPAWQLFLINLLNFTSSTSATAGTASLPARPAGFMNVTVAGKQYKVPYYNQ